MLFLSHFNKELDKTAINLEILGKRFRNLEKLFLDRTFPLNCVHHHSNRYGKKYGGSNLQVAGRRLQVIVAPIQKVSQTFLKANLRPKNFCLGIIGLITVFDAILTGPGRQSGQKL